MEEKTLKQENRKAKKQKKHTGTRYQKGYRLMSCFISLLVSVIITIIPIQAVSGYLNTGSVKGNGLEEKVDNLIKKYRVPGAAFAYINHGKIAFVKTYGFSDKEKKQKTTKDTAYKIASISKSITAYAIMQLVDAGKLDLDRPISRYLTKWKIPDSRFDREKVTLRTLLSHTSGLSDSSEYGYSKPLPSIEEALVQRDIRLIREPGSKFSYSSFAGFGICQLILEEVTGRPFEEYMREKVFLPLNMKGAGFYNNYMGQYKLAVPYAGLGKRTGVIPIVMTGAGGVSATGEDMAHFVIAMINYYHNSNKEMFKPQKNTKSQYGVYSLGIIPHKLPDGTVVYEHNGTLTGWNAQIAFEPERKSGIVLLSNSDKAFYLTNDVMKVWSREISGYGAEEKPYTDSMTKNIYLSVIILGLILMVSWFSFLFRYYKNQGKYQVSRRKKKVTKRFMILVGIITILWYGILYTDWVFNLLYGMPDYCPFTFATRNIDLVGRELILAVAVLGIKNVFISKSGENRKVSP